MMIRIVIVEDQPGVRQGLRMLLDAESDLSVIGEASDGEDALMLAASLGPDVVLMDVEMRRMDGIAATTALHQAFPRIPIILLSIHDDAGTRARVDGAGRRDFRQQANASRGARGVQPFNFYSPRHPNRRFSPARACVWRTTPGRSSRPGSTGPPQYRAKRVFTDGGQTIQRTRRRVRHRISSDPVAVPSCSSVGCCRTSISATVQFRIHF